VFGGVVSSYLRIHARQDRFLVRLPVRLDFAPSGVRVSEIEEIPQDRFRDRDSFPRLEYAESNCVDQGEEEIVAESPSKRGPAVLLLKLQGSWVHSLDPSDAVEDLVRRNDGVICDCV